MKTNLQKIQGIYSQYILELDKNFKESGKRKYLLNEVTVKDFLPTIQDDVILLADIVDFSVIIRPKDEAQLKRCFKTFDAQNKESIQTVISSLNRAYDDTPQGEPKWHQIRETLFTSTDLHIGSRGDFTSRRFVKDSYKIARELGGEIGEKIISSMISQKEAEDKGLEWEAPMTRGTRQESITRNYISSLLGEEIEENGIHLLSGTSFGDSDDGSFVATKEFELPNGQKIIKGQRVVVEIKNPSFPNFIDPSYVNVPSKKTQIQAHLIVGGADVVLFVKNFMGFTPQLELVYLDEEFAFKFLEKMLIEEERSKSCVAQFTQDFNQKMEEGLEF